MVTQLSAEIEAKHEAVRRYMAEKGETIVSENPIRPIPHEMSPLAHAQYMFSEPFIEWVMRIFLSHVWLIGDNQTGQHLFTSDAPVTRSSAMRGCVIGYGARGIEIALPLSSRFMLMLFERSWFTQTRSLKDGDVLMLDRDVVRHYNARQVCDSLRQVYCQEDQFELAIEVTKQFPEVCEPGRSRFSIGGRFE